MKKILKIIGIILLVILIIFAILCAIYHDAAKAVFYNLIAQIENEDPGEDNWTGGKSYLNVQYSDVSENDYVNIYVPDGVENPPLIVVVHGGGFITDDATNRPAQRVYRYFRDHGFACASVNYRLAQEAAYPAAICDVKSCIKYLKANADKYGYDASNIAITGESAGGYLACAVALSGDDEFNDLAYIGQDVATESASVRVLVDFYGAVNFTDTDAMWKELHYPNLIINIANSWLSGDVLQGYPDVESFWLRKDVSTLTDEEAKQYEIAGFIERNITKDTNLNVWISHGDCDITLPILESEQLYEDLCNSLGEEKVHLNIVNHAGHASDSIYTDEQLEMIRQYILENSN